jgi:hypothetical protein
MPYVFRWLIAQQLASWMRRRETIGTSTVPCPSWQPHFPESLQFSCLYPRRAPLVALATLTLLTHVQSMLQARLSEGITAIVALFGAPKAQTRQLLLVLLNHFHQVLFNIVPSSLVLRFVALFWWFFPRYCIEGLQRLLNRRHSIIISS